MDFIYIHPLCKMICADCLSLRGYVVGCLHSVGIAHLSIETGFSPCLISRQIFLIIQGKISVVLQVFSSTMIHFCPVYLHFVHASGNECFTYSHQAFNMSELGTENHLLFGSFQHRVWNNPSLLSVRWQRNLHFRGTAWDSFQPQCSFPRNCFQTAPAQKSMCHILLLVKCSVLPSVLTIKDLSQSVISLLSTWMFCGSLFCIHFHCWLY